MSRQGIHFGTDGWRAVIAQGFTFENVEIVVTAIAQYLTEKKGTDKPVVIGHDTRFLAKDFAAFAADVLKSHGFSVLLTQGFKPTPAVAHAAMAYDTCGALMFTASHNPPEYMGIKFIPEYAGPATKDITDNLVERIRVIEQNPDAIPQGNGGGNIEFFDPMPKYVEGLAQVIDFDAIRKHRKKVLYDPMYGTGQSYIHQILEDKAGWSIDKIHDAHDPFFGGQLPEPKVECVPELVKRVTDEKYDVGFANDGDADRFGVVDERGNFYGTNQMIPLFFWYLYHHKKQRGAVVRTVATSLLLDKLAEKVGVTVHQTPVGFKHVGELMRNEPIIVGGEESGGVSILNHIPEKDGVMAIMLTLEMMAVLDKPLSEIYEDLLNDADIRLHGIYDNLHLSEAQKKDVMDQMYALKAGEIFAGKPIESIDSQDGVKIYFGPYEWLLIRPSGTEPILRMYSESTDPTQIPKFKEAVEALKKLEKEPASCSVP
ncbi:MAG: phosphoglucomutase/phosphomannomutase family protein [Vampirovibrio sp.]|nr:phosphoglucomutase/phosphomannomutase family protein [Vampirovibrio sp.]